MVDNWDGIRIEFVVCSSLFVGFMSLFGGSELWSCSWRGDNEWVELDTYNDQTSRGMDLSARRTRRVMSFPPKNLVSNVFRVLA